jgi:tetratricopeptide (TPR) repeat protein
LIHEHLNLPFLPSVFSRNWLSWCLVERGDFAEGLARAEEGVRIAEEVGQWWSRIVAYFSVGVWHLRKGDFDKAIPNLERGLGLCQASEIPIWLAWTSATLGHAYALSGRVAEALPLLEHAVELMISFVPNRSLWMAYLAEAYLLAGRVDDATRLALRALDLGRDHKEHGNQAWALRLIAEIAVHREPPEVEQARNQYSQALALATDLGMRPLQARCHLGFGKLYRRTGDRPKAQRHLTTATAMFREMDMRFWLEQAEAELKALGARSTKKAKKRT